MEQDKHKNLRMLLYCYHKHSILQYQNQLNMHDLPHLLLHFKVLNLEKQFLFYEEFL